MFENNLAENSEYKICIKRVFENLLKDQHMVRNLIFVVVALGVGVISSLGAPFLLKIIIDSLLINPATIIIYVFMGYGLLWLLSQISMHVRELIAYRIEQRITYILGFTVLSHLHTLSQGYFLNQKAGAITNIIRRAQTSVPPIIVGGITHVLPTIIEFLCVTILIANFYPPIFCVLLTGTLIAFFIYTLRSTKSALIERQSANEIDKTADGIITDWISNHEAIRVFGQQETAVNICSLQLKRRENAESRFMTKLAFVRLGQSLILGAGLTALTCLVGKSVANGHLSVGDFVLLNGYMLQFITPISILGQITQSVNRSILDMKEFLDILLTKSDIIEASHPTQLSSTRYNLEFNNVSFNYKDRNILKNISLKIKAGKTLVIMGPTGIGKSTIAKLLLRLYDPTEGEILVNGTNLKQVSFRTLHEIFGWVPQETYLINDTIKNNLLFVCPEASDRRIEAALDQACLLNFIRKLPEGINTIVGERGLKLSSGEKQRISLARIFLKRPSICIFDEASSCLDRHTELKIQNNIETFLPNITKIIITHRPFMMKNADFFISLSKSGISEEHKHPYSNKESGSLTSCDI